MQKSEFFGGGSGVVVHEGLEVGLDAVLDGLGGEVGFSPRSAPRAEDRRFTAEQKTMVERNVLQREWRRDAGSVKVVRLQKLADYVVLMAGAAAGSSWLNI